MHGPRTMRAVVAAYAVLLASCSGGSGGAGGGTTGGGGGGGGISVAVDRTSFTFAGFPTYYWPSQRVNFTLLGGSGTYYGEIVQDRAGAFSTAFQVTGATTAYATLTPSSFPSGTSIGTVTFRLCNDSACSSVAWSKAIPYTVTVFAPTPSSYTLPVVGYEGSAVTKTITISPPDDGGVLAASVTSGAFLSVVRRSASEFEVTASGVGLTAGTTTYRGTVQLAPPATLGQGRSFEIDFTVGPGIVAPAPTTLALRVGSATTGAIPVAFQGGIAPSWTASADRPWLVLGATSGTGPGSIPWSIDTAQLGGVANWGSDVATVRLSSAGLSDATSAVTLQVQLPEIHAISPPAVPAGQAATVTAYGRGLSQLSDPGAIAVTGGAGASSTFDSDTQATVQLPALAEGRHAVSVPNALGVATPATDVGASAVGAWTSATVAHVGEKRCAFHDPTRAAVYAVDSTASAIVRYRYATGAWQVDASAAIPSIGDAALSADGRTIWVAAGTSSLVAVDPDTLAVDPTAYPMTLSWQSYSMANATTQSPGLQVTNDARLWFSTTGSFSLPFYFDTIRRAFFVHTWIWGSAPLSQPKYAASRDGARLLVSEPSVTPPQHDALYTAATDTFASTPYALDVFSGVVLDGAGRHALVGNTALWAVDAWTRTGTVSISNGYAHDAGFSPDGARLYVSVVQLGSSVPVRVDVLDTANVVSGTTNLAKLGEIPISGVASACPTGSPSTCIPGPVFVMSPLGDAIFLVGNQSMLVVPIPASLGGP